MVFDNIKDAAQIKIPSPIEAMNQLASAAWAPHNVVADALRVGRPPIPTHPLDTDFLNKLLNSQGDIFKSVTDAQFPPLPPIPGAEVLMRPRQQGQTQDVQEKQHATPTDNSGGSSIYTPMDNKEAKVAEATQWLSEKMKSQNMSSVSEIDLLRGLRGKGPFKAETEEQKDMLMTILENYDSIKNAHKDTVDRSGFGPIKWGGHENENLTMKDLGVVKFEADRNTKVQEASRNLVDGDPSLFRILDSSKNGKEDGKISKTDMEMFLKDCERFKSNPVGPFNETNRKMVEQMLKDWNNPESPTAKMRGAVSFDEKFDLARGNGYDYITPQTLAKGLGLPRPSGSLQNQLTQLSDMLSRETA